MLDIRPEWVDCCVADTEFSFIFNSSNEVNLSKVGNSVKYRKRNCRIFSKDAYCVDCCGDAHRTLGTERVFFGEGG